MYYYRGNEDANNQFRPGDISAGAPLYQQDLQARANISNKYYSNIGADNPAKFRFALPRSLFYDAAKMDPDVKQAEKYGLFMFYSFDGSGGDNYYLDQYYLSERPEYSKKISSPESKNPTAAKLVKDSIASNIFNGTSSDSDSSIRGASIIGGVHAPYYWKDFIYCKYYGTIPNNRLITVRRFTSPVLDNFSLPSGLRTPENLKKGVGMPSAQAVTWFGGNTGNTLSSLIGFSTGLTWNENVPIDPDRVQAAFGDGLIDSVAFDMLSDLVAKTGDGSAGVKTTEENKRLGIEALSTALSPDKEQLTRDRYYRSFFDQVKSDTTGRFGLLSEKIWVPVDVIKSTTRRDFGLEFTWSDLVINFSYDLTSVGEVNTKAAMFDILGNLLSIGTNYGNFLTPYIKYDSTYSALTFPGGDEGAKLFFTDLYEFVKQNVTKMFIADSSEGTAVGGASVTKAKVENFDDKLKQLQTDLDDNGKIENTELAQELFGAIQSVFAEQAAGAWQAPLSLYTGAAIGEWHVVIGNPYNPIAMIGNLICKGIEVNFSNTLGPDDFPTGIEAKLTLGHARPRERGEIESIFNRGDGRLYQSVQNTASNAQTYFADIDLNGNVFTPNTIPGFFQPEDGGLPGSGGPVTFSDSNFSLGEEDNN